MGTLVIVDLPQFIDFGNVKFSPKSLYLCLYPFAPIDLYVCDPLGPYIFIINDSIDPIALTDLPYQLTIINI